MTSFEHNKGKTMPRYLTEKEIVTVKYVEKRVYFLTDPDGVVHETTSLNQFCKEHGLSQGNMSSVINGRYSQHKGWTGYSKMMKIQKVTRKPRKKSDAPKATKPRGSGYPIEVYLERMNEMHGDKYDYKYVRDDYAGNIRSIVRIECREHGVFNMTIHQHIHKTRVRDRHCPDCAKDMAIEKRVPKTKRPKPKVPVFDSQMRTYVLNNGRIICAPLKEMQIIKILNDRGVDGDDLMVWEDKDIPMIEWFPNRMDKKVSRYYFPEIYVKSTKTIVHILSSLDELKDVTLLKIRDQCIRDGYRFEMWEMKRSLVGGVYL